MRSRQCGRESGTIGNTVNRERILSRYFNGDDPRARCAVCLFVRTDEVSMRSQWLIIDFGTEPGFPRRRPDRVSMNVPRVPHRHLHWLSMAMLLLSSGCITPCLSGVCNSSQPLYISPMSRFGSVEKKLPDACEPEVFCKPLPYFTFGKYWPKLDEWRTTRTALKCARKNLLRKMWETKTWIDAHYREGFA